ncbi:MAG: hypothetical protein HY826_03520 [Actinobacteria bacterium]|nr:hypothetical protein [Actinomycetota bacterium]
MGNNESLPPPPPPGQPPQQPANWPPQPTAPMPTQAYPPQGFSPAVAAPKKGNGMLIGGGLVVAAALVGGVVLLTGGDDKKSTSITLAPIESSTTSGISVTTASSTPVVITAPPTVAPTAAPDTTAVDSNIVQLFDDTGAFSVYVPSDLETDTSAITSNDGFTVPSVSAADSISAYYNDDGTFGMTIIAVGPDIGSDAAQVMAFLSPPDNSCTGRTDDVVETALGSALRSNFETCGNELGNKVLLVVALAGRPVVVGIYVQSQESVELIQPLAQAILETIQAV